MGCFAIQSPVYLPAMRLIASITREIFPTVTTTFAHNYTTNQYIRFKIPNDYGMVQINNLVGIIAVTGPTTFLVAINTVLFDAFVIPVYPAPRLVLQCAQIVPVGESSFTLEGAVRNVL